MCLLSPLVAEYLLGNISVDALYVLPYMLPMYGGGAVLIREIARRTGRGWPTIILLALAYGLIEEGFATQSLFAPTYFGFDLISSAYIAPLGIGAWWTLYVLSLHTIWSICVPIAMVEALAGERARAPWLGKIGLIVSLLLFLGGCAFTAYATYQQEKFMASSGQFVGLAIVISLIVFVAFRSRHARVRVARPVPRPWVVSLWSLIAGSAFVMTIWFVTGWVAAATYLVLYAVVICFVLRWSSSVEWTDQHVLALAGGALLTYAWQAFPHEPIVGSKGEIDLVGNVIFATGAIVLLAVAVLKQRRSTSFI